MRNAPSARYPVGRCRFHGFFILLLACVSLGLMICWSLTTAVAPSVVWSSSLLLLVLVVNAGYRWQTTRMGELIWTGQTWRYSSQANAADAIDLTIQQVRVVLDLQSTVLIRTIGVDGAICWFWTERRSFPLRWLAHRRALFATVRPVGTVKTHAPFTRTLSAAELDTKTLQGYP